jgi:hypothetical protein
MGFCLGLISIPLNMAFEFYLPASIDTELSFTKFLRYLKLPITIPLLYMFGALFSYPIYSFLHSKGIALKLKTCGN